MAELSPATGSPGSAWKPMPAWQTSAKPGRFGASGEAGVTVTIPKQLGAAMLIVSEETRRDFRAAMTSGYGIVPPATPRREAANGVELIWAGPHRWLARSADRTFPQKLARQLGGLAAVTDQSDARTCLRLEGPQVRAVLAKGCAIDLHPRVFRSGDVALTAIAYMSVHLWQLDEAPAYELAVFRSMAGSFWSWLSASAAEFGANVVVER